MVCFTITACISSLLDHNSAFLVVQMGSSTVHRESDQTSSLLFGGERERDAVPRAELQDGLLVTYCTVYPLTTHCRQTINL